MAATAEFENLALPHLDSVYRAALAICRQPVQAEDLVQMTYVKALERFGSFRPGTNCKAWLLAILRNLWIDELRHRKVVGTVVSVDDEGPVLADPPHAADPPASGNVMEVLDGFSDDQIRRALEDLPEDQRLALVLTDVEGLSQQEVAEVLGVPEGTVKSRTSRARAALKAKLMAHAMDLGLLGRKR
jgi:RNA polymerase sigma-70 factor, ECF subfamily